VNYGRLFRYRLRSLNIKGKYDLRDYIKKEDYEFAEDFMERS
jgi:hypothetical protein